MSTTSEQAVAAVRASVMIYDDGGKRWLPAGQSGQQAESKVQLFQHLRVGTFRIVARKGQEHEVVLNCPLYGAMKYNQTTTTFHQWRNEQRQLFGLNFVSHDDAQSFGQAVARAVEAINVGAGVGGGHQQVASQNGTYDHQHNGLSGVASAPALLRQSQQPSSHYQQQPFVGHPASIGDYCPQPLQQQQLQPSSQQVQQQQQRISQDDAHNQQQYALYQQPQPNEAYYGVSPALHLQQHQRQPSAGSNASSSGSSGCTTSQTSNLIYSTVTPTNVMPSPSRPAPPVPPPPPPTPPATSKAPSAPTPAGGVPPAPPPPPPFAANGTSTGKQPINLAQAISNQKLRKVPSGAPTAGRSMATAEESLATSKDGRSASVGSVDASLSAVRIGNNSGFGGSSGGHSDVISEMAATLARRRLMAESGSATSSQTITNGETTASDSPTKANEKGADIKQKPWESRNGSRPSLNDAPSSNTDSPKTHRKVPSGSSLSSQEDVGLSLMSSGAGGGSGVVGPAHRSLSNGPTSSAAPVLVTGETLEQWKQEILNEVRREINKVKSEIIDALKSELNRR